MFFRRARSVLLQLAVGAGIFSLSAIAPAQAQTLYFDYTSTSGDGVTAYGSLTLGTPVTDGFDISGINGVFYNGSVFSTISGLIDPATCAITSPCDLFSPTPDNVLYFPTPPYLDYGGFAFSDLAGDTVSIAWLAGDTYSAVWYNTSLCSVGNFGCFDEGTFAVTPLPAALPLLGTVLAAGYFVGSWRRRRDRGRDLHPAGIIPA